MDSDLLLDDADTPVPYRPAYESMRYLLLRG